MKEDIKNKNVDIGIVIPEDYTLRLRDGKMKHDAPIIQIYGSLNNTKYMIAVLMATDFLYTYGMDVQEITLLTIVYLVVAMILYKRRRLSKA